MTNKNCDWLEFFHKAPIRSSLRGLTRLNPITGDCVYKAGIILEDYVDSQLYKKVIHIVSISFITCLLHFLLPFYD